MGDKQRARPRAEAKGKEGISQQAETMPPEEEASVSDNVIKRSLSVEPQMKEITFEVLTPTRTVCTC